MELVRVGQAYFMIRDNKMYDETSNSRFQCRALNINEDLGQIKYVFSDKTGTLTENKMEFKYASIFGVDYSGDKADVDGDQRGYCIHGTTFFFLYFSQVSIYLSIIILRNHLIIALCRRNNKILMLG